MVGRSIEYEMDDPIFKLNRKIVRKNRQSVEVEKDSKREFLEQLESSSPEKN